MPAVAIGAVISVQRRGAVFGAFGGCGLRLAAGRIAVLALAGLMAQGGLTLLLVLLASRALCGKDVVHAAERCGELRLLPLPSRSLFAAHGIPSAV